MPSITTDSFLTALAKSNLLSPERLTKVRIEATATGSGADAKTMARRLVKQGLLTRWQAEQLLAGVTSFFLGRYKLLERIGKGGMGTVYKAEHTVMGRTVALKVMSQSLLNDAGAVARFQREVQAAASLQHPHIVTAYDADCVGKTHFLVMEYVEGHDLKERLQQQGRLSVSWVCECIRQAALGLQHAHEHGMVHRDIKPANLLVTQERPDGPPIVKILDMGLARFVSDIAEDGGLTKSGQVMGTPDYIAPEQAEDTKHADIRADIFSLGCSLFHLLTGRTPYQGETLMSKLMARMQGTAPLASSLRSDVPEALDAVIAKMLKRNPADRQQTPAEVAAALAPFAASMDAAFEDTIAVTHVAVTTPTVDMQDSQPKVDTGLNKFLSELANTPDHRKQRVGQRSISQKRTEPAPKDVAPEGGELSAEADEEHVVKFPRRIIFIAAASVAVVLLGGLSALVLTRDSTALVQTESVAPEVSEPESGLQRFLDESVETSDTSGVTNSSIPEFVDSASPHEALPSLIPVGDSEMEGDIPAATASGPVSPVVTSSDPHVAQTLVVGIGAGEVPDLNAAFEQAGPGDTILIRHRGPLEFHPVDLNGKTPLTIVGDTDTGGIDFWPILRQIPLNSGDSTQPTAAVGMFHANQLGLTFRKLHLVVAGRNRAAIGAIFAMGRGRLELDECTITVGVQGHPGEPAGPPVQFVHITPLLPAPETANNESTIRADTSENESSGVACAEVILNRTFLRGSRLQSCVAADSEQPLKLTATHTIWAGGPSPWLVINDHGGGSHVTLSNCTVYNVPRLLEWKSYENTTTEKPAVEFTVQKSLFVGPYANKEPLMVWNEGTPNAGFDRAAAEGSMLWQGSDNIFHRYPSYFQIANARKQPGLDEWRTLWKQSGPSMAQEADPMFRVWPDGEEIQETTARDYQSRFWKAKRGTRTDDEVGAEQARMPYAFVDIFGRPLSNPEAAGMPRGVPRILPVHQKDGPYKTLEAAFADAQDEDIIEITDNGPYTPRRNFDSAPANGVLISPPGHLTFRARDGADPVVVLRDDVQTGQLPVPQGSEGRALVLLSTSMASTSLTIEGIHFRSAVLRPIRRTVLCCPIGDVVRVSSCTFLDVGHPLGNASGGYLGPDPANSALFLLTDRQRLIWLENTMFYPANRDACWSLFSYNGFPRLALNRNCGCEGTLAKLNAGMQLNLDLRSCTLIGNVSGLNYPSVLRANDNLVYSSTTLFPPEVAGVLGSIRVEGANNCVWIGDRRLTEAERMGGIPGLIRGPLMASVPSTEGPATTRDPHRRYRLKKGQPATKMAADGGLVGLRFEYLPDLSAVPTAFFEGL